MLKYVEVKYVEVKCFPSSCTFCVCFGHKVALSVSALTGWRCVSLPTPTARFVLHWSAEGGETHLVVLQLSIFRKGARQHSDMLPYAVTVPDPDDSANFR